MGLRIHISHSVFPCSAIHPLVYISLPRSCHCTIIKWMEIYTLFVVCSLFSWIDGEQRYIYATTHPGGPVFFHFFWALLSVSPFFLWKAKETSAPLSTLLLQHQSIFALSCLFVCSFQCLFAELYCRHARLCCPFLHFSFVLWTKRMPRNRAPNCGMYKRRSPHYSRLTCVKFNSNDKDEYPVFVFFFMRPTQMVPRGGASYTL